MMPSTRRHYLQSSWALGLAVAATSTALCMSVLAGWQRGGWFAERLVWVAIGAVLVIGAHLVPTLCRSTPLAIRCVGGLLWVACMVATSYGHATFFILSQQHAGQARAAGVFVANTPDHRSLTAVMRERADMTAALAVANARRCVRDCASLQVRRVSLTARVDALDAEADEVRRQQTSDDHNAVRQEALRDDPVTTRLAALLALSPARVDLFAGLVFAAVLESVACLFWWIGLQPRSPVTASAVAVRAPVTVDKTAGNAASTGTVTTPRSVSRGLVIPIDTEVTQLARDIAAGHVRPTVSGIRRHLGCSQAKASALRRQLTLLA
jgi:hypothetical protein